MSRKKLVAEIAKKAVYGGCILGGGGGGWIQRGLERSKLAFDLGQVELVTIDELADDDYVVCVSSVGAPSAEESYVDSEQLVRTITRMQQEFDKPIKAIMTNENGANGTVNGWIQSAATGLPLLDAPCNGRAHPTGTMGSLNLSEIEGYTSIQTFAGGKGEREVEGTIKATLNSASSITRQMSVQAGGTVGVCRNPVQVKYIKEHAALGGITQAIGLGEAFFAAEPGIERIRAATQFLNGEVLRSGKITSYELSKSGGFDVGVLYIDDLELTIWNEYMTAEIAGERVGSFPDLIMTFDTKTGNPLVSAEIKEGMDVTVINVLKENLKLSSTMFNEKLLRVIEPIINKKIID